MSDLPTGYSHDEYCVLLAEAAEQFAEVTRGVDPTVPVPTCPGWTVAEVIRHTGTIHRWVTKMVDERSPERIDPRTVPLALPDDDRWLPGWLAAGATTLVESLVEADPTDSMWSWGAQQNVGFWSRRMLYETTIHRIDSERDLARAEIDPLVAADGIDERFANIGPSAAFSPGVEELHGEGTLGFAALDRALGPAAYWLVSLERDGFEVVRSDKPKVDNADVRVSGPPDRLLLVLYGRLSPESAGLSTVGDRSLLSWWLDRSGLA